MLFGVFDAIGVPGSVGQLAANQPGSWNGYMQEGERRQWDNERSVDARHLLRMGREGGRTEEEEGYEKLLYAALREVTVTSVPNVVYP